MRDCDAEELCEGLCEIDLVSVDDSEGVPEALRLCVSDWLGVVVAVAVPERVPVKDAVLESVPLTLEELLELGEAV